MSTSFAIFPATNVIPAFEAVLARAEAHMDRFLRNGGLLVHVVLHASIRQGEPDVELFANATGPMSWDDGHYAWFQVERIRGGADAYSHAAHGESTRDYLKETLIPRRPELAKTLEIDRHWSIRCSANETGVVRIMSGFVAAAIAELTEGFVFSDDGAWTFNGVAKTAAEFLAEFGSGDWIDWVKDDLLGDE